MIISPAGIAGAFVIDIERQVDERGFFARTWCVEETRSFAPDFRVLQCSVSFGARKGTVRGLHYQARPCEEFKIVRCTAGAIYDVIVDLRPDSPTYKMWAASELSAENRRQVYVPAGVAHGFQTLADRTEVFYQMSELYHPECSRGVAWDDPAFGIFWPPDERTISSRDSSYPPFTSSIVTV